MARLDGKTAIVTGAGTGIGRTIAIEFVKAGANIALVGRTRANVEKVAGEISELGKRALALTADVSVAEQVRKMVEQTVQEFGRIDILVNNAGVVHRALIVDTLEEDWDRLMAINLKSVFLCIRAVAGPMMRQNYGKIVNISSGAGLRAGAALAGYGVSKGGIIQLTRTAALELGPYGINVNSICPGLIETDMYKRIRTPAQVAEFEDSTIKTTFMRRLGSTRDIANLVLFLASDESSFITGENVVIDGGR